jgi:DNA-binding transcriptional LysR family regulator
MRYVDEVARTGSIRRAAERLNVTPSAINRRIADLETELGTALFERLPRGMRPTSAGELLLRHIRAQAADLDLVRSQLEELRGLRRGDVRLACSQALAYRLVGGAIAGFRATAPLIRFQVTVSDHSTALAMLAAYEIDLALVVGATAASEVLVLARVEQPLVAVLPEGHPLAVRGTTLRLRDLADETLVLPDRSLTSRQILDAALRKRGLDLAATVECNSFDVLWHILRVGGGVSVQLALGAPPVAGPAEAGLVARPLDPREVPPATITLCQLRARALPVAPARFAAALAEHLGSLGAVR